MRNRHGFTLIELLVVLVILAVLAAILFPVFMRARASARRAVCVSQLRQLCQAARMYWDDNDRVIVPARTAVTSTGTLGITWCVLLQPYMQNKNILICPEDSNPQPTARSVCLPHSYGINYSLAFNSLWGPYPFVASVSHIGRPSETILFFELTGSAQAMGASYYSHGLSRVDWRHNGVGNFGFVDGHVKGLRRGDANNLRLWDPFS